MFVSKQSVLVGALWTAMLCGSAPAEAIDAAAANGVPVCTAPGGPGFGYNLGRPPATIVSDLAGGAIVTWVDGRSGTGADIYVQRINGAGDAQWTVNGVAACTDASNQTAPALVSDGAGGAIVIWDDDRNGSSNLDLYAQRIDATGTPRWTTNGVPVCTAMNDQEFPAITSDGSGGAIATWGDQRAGVPFAVYAQRIDGSGAQLWTTDGVYVGGTDVQGPPTIVEDGSSGAIVAWFETLTNTKVLAQRVSAAGHLLWPTVTVCAVSVSNRGAAIVSDGAGGAIVAWRNIGTLIPGIRAQRLSGLNGSQLWGTSGVGVQVGSGSNGSNLFYPTLAADGAGGALIAWPDARNGAANIDIYAQRVDYAGTLLWTSGGVAVCGGAQNQTVPVMVSDGALGAIVAWVDNRSVSGTDVYAQRIDAGGAPLWKSNGVPLCALGGSLAPVIVSDGASGAIVAWPDGRAVAPGVYAQHVNTSGLVLDVPRPTQPGSRLAQAWPDPFRDQVRIAFDMSVASSVHMEVLDAGGRRVWSSPPERLEPGRHAITWNGNTNDHRRLRDGIYFLRVEGGGFEATTKVLRLN